MKFHVVLGEGFAVLVTVIDSWNLNDKRNQQGRERESVRERERERESHHRPSPQMPKNGRHVVFQLFPLACFEALRGHVHVTYIHTYVRTYVQTYKNADLHTYCELSCLSCLVHSHMLVPAVTFSPQAPHSADLSGTAEVAPH